MYNAFSYTYRVYYYLFYYSSFVIIIIHYLLSFDNRINKKINYKNSRFDLSFFNKKYLSKRQSTCR